MNSGKRKILTAGGLIRPEDVAVKPKPSINALKRSLKPELGAAGILKKPREPGQGPSTSIFGLSTPATVPVLEDMWRDFCRNTEAKAETFAQDIANSVTVEKYNKTARLMCAAIRTMMERKADDGKSVMEYQFITVIAATIKEKATLLENNSLQHAFLALLCSMKSFPMDAQELIASLVKCLMNPKQKWGTFFINAYLRDALSERQWSDKPFCLFIVENILKPFNTVFPRKELYIGCNDLPAPEVVPTFDHVTCRFNEPEVHDLVMPVLRKWCESRGDQPTRALVRTLLCFMGVPEIRLLCSKKLDQWVQNGKVQRNALEMMLFMAVNIGNTRANEADGDTLSYLLRMRSLKSKQVHSVYVVMLREILSKTDDNYIACIRLIIANEIGAAATRYPLNWKVLDMIFQLDQQKTAQVLGREIAKIVCAREENAKPARLFTRELARTCQRCEFPFSVFTQSYLEEIAVNFVSNSPEQLMRSSCELLSMLPLMACGSTVREAFNVRRIGGNVSSDQNAIISRFIHELAQFFEIVMRWLRLRRDRLGMIQRDFTMLYYRFLYLEKSDFYTLLDLNPNEQEFAQIMKVIGEFRMYEHVLWQIVGDMGETCALEVVDAIEIVEELTKRAIEHRSHADADVALISMEDPVKFFDRLFEIGLYRPPPPHAKLFFSPGNAIAIRNFVWKVWMIIVLHVAAGDTTSILGRTYELFPQLRYLIHMIITKDFRFPLLFENSSEPEMIALEKKEELRERELIFALESKLAGQTITEENGALINIACTNYPREVLRRPPETFLKELSELASRHQLATNLCACREPDLILNLIRSSGPQQAMPAIMDMISSSDSSIQSLPLVALTQLLCFNTTIADTDEALDDAKKSAVVARIRMAFMERGVDEEAKDSLMYLLKQFADDSYSTRKAASTVLDSIFSDSMEGYFTPHSLSNCFMFNDIKNSASVFISKALLYEKDVQRVKSMIDFLLDGVNATNMHQMAFNLSQLTTRCSPEIYSELIEFFVKYMEQATANPYSFPVPSTTKDAASVPESEKCRVKLKTTEVEICYSCISAIFHLLCSTDKGLNKARQQLVETWLPGHGTLPEVTRDGEVLELMQPTVRSKMLSASDSRIAEVALEGVSGDSALRLLCVFALPNYSASRLLQVVDATEIDSLDESALRAALPFIIAYRSRGATGGDKIVNRLREQKAATKSEAMEVHRVMAPLPKLTTSLNLSSVVVLTKQQFVQMLKGLTVAGSTFMLSSAAIQAAHSNETIAMAAVDHLEGHLKFFLDHPDAFHALLTLLHSCSGKYPKVNTRVSTLAAKVLKSATTHSSIVTFLRKFAPNPSLDEASTSSTTLRSCEEILEQLSLKDTNESRQRSTLVMEYLKNRPEVFDCSQPNSASFEKQVVDIFTGRNGVDELVRQISLRSSERTVAFVLEHLLDHVYQNVDVTLVCEFIARCVKTSFGAFFKDQQLLVLAAYLAELVAVDQQYITLAKEIIDDVVAKERFQVLPPMCQVFLSMVRSNIPLERRNAIENLLNSVQDDYPCLVVPTIGNSVHLSGRLWMTPAADRQCSLLVSQVMDSADAEEVRKALCSLRQFVKTYPRIFMRHFGMLANHLSTMVNLSSRELKSDVRREIISILISSAIKLMPEFDDDYLDHIDTSIELLLVYFERNRGTALAPAALADSIVCLVAEYLDRHTLRAREFLQLKTSSIEALCKLCDQKPHAIKVRDNIAQLRND